jgi:hypothetical protein
VVVKEWLLRTAFLACSPLFEQVVTLIRHLFGMCFEAFQDATSTWFHLGTIFLHISCAGFSKMLHLVPSMIFGW